MAGKQLKVTTADAAVLERALLVAAATLEPDEMSQRQLFQRLMPKLYVMRKKGFSFAQIGRVLEAAGLRLSIATVRSYYADYQQTNMEVLEAQWVRTSAALKKLQMGHGQEDAAAAAHLLLGTEAGGPGRRRGLGAGAEATATELARDVSEVRESRQAAIDAVAVTDSRDLVRALAANGGQRRTSNGLRAGVVERLRLHEQEGDGGVGKQKQADVTTIPSPATISLVQPSSDPGTVHVRPGVPTEGGSGISVENLMGLALPATDSLTTPLTAAPSAPDTSGGNTNGLGGVEELRCLQSPEERKLWVANKLANGLGGQPLPMILPVMCLTQPKLGESFTAAQLVDMPVEIRDTDEVLEHPAISGLMLTREQRLYGQRLRFVDGDGMEWEEPIKLVGLRVKWQAPAARGSGESAKGFVRMDVGRLGGQKI